MKKPNLAKIGKMVAKHSDGKWYVMTDFGTLVAGPFDTNAKARKWLDRLEMQKP